MHRVHGSPDWELDRRVKLDDKVTFPMTLDMAPYLCEGDEQPGAEVAQPDPESDGGEAAGFEPAFGRDGALIRPVDKRVADQSGGTLPYELFAVLVHRGTAAFGHYYAYVKDFATGQWLNFNDGTVTAASVSDVESAFGGKVSKTTAYSGYGAGTASTQSTASAYMVMYRRKDEASNIQELTKEMVPARVLEEIDRQAKEKAEKDAEAAAIKAQLALNVYSASRVACLSLARSTSWGSVKAQALEQLGGLEGIGLDASSQDCWRMRTIKFLHDDCADEILDDDDSTELIKVKAIKTYGATDLVIETKRPGEEWPRTYGEFGPPGYQHHRVFKLALYLPGSGGEGDETTEAAGDVLSAGAAGSMSPWKTIMFGYKATLGDLREAAADAFGTQAGMKICKLDLHSAQVIELVGDDSVSVTSLRHPMTLTSGDRLYIADARHATAAAGPDFKAAASEAGERAIVHFTEVDSDAYTLHIEVDKKIPIVDLKGKISGVLGAEADSVSLHDPEGRLISHASNHARRVRVMVKTATASAGSANRTQKMPVYLYKGDKDDLSTLLLKEMEVDTQLSVAAFKTVLRAQLAAATVEGQSADQYGPEDGSHLRVRKLDYSSAVWMNSQTVAQAMGVTYYGASKLGVTVLSGPEVKTSKEQVVISVARWRPSTLEIDQVRTIATQIYSKQGLVTCLPLWRARLCLLHAHLSASACLWRACLCLLHAHLSASACSVLLNSSRTASWWSKQRWSAPSSESSCSRCSPAAQLVLTPTPQQCLRHLQQRLLPRKTSAYYKKRIPRTARRTCGKELGMRTASLPRSTPITRGKKLALQWSHTLVHVLMAVYGTID